MRVRCRIARAPIDNGAATPMAKEGSVPCGSHPDRAASAWPHCRPGGVLVLAAARRLRLLGPRPVRHDDQDGLRAGLPVDQSFRRDVNLQLTELVIKEIEQRTPYKVVGTPEEADTILDGTINFADKNLVVENPYNLPARAQRHGQRDRELDAQPAARSRSRPRPPTIVTETVNFIPEVGETVADRLLPDLTRTWPRRSSI